MKRTFEVTVSKTVEVTLDDRVTKQGLRDDNPILGKGATLQEVVEHLAFNLVCNQLSLSRIDGYANFKDGLASVSMAEWEVEANV